MMKNDQFADIAASGVHTEGKGLEKIIPSEAVCERLPLENGGTMPGMVFPKKMDTKEELYQELERQKKKYRPYMQKLAPRFHDLRQRHDLREFLWRVEEEADRKNFSRVLNGEGNWKAVTVPHYGEPLGKETAYYRTDFYAGRPGEGQALFIHFNGVDYIGHVFLNGAYIGSHEGFFAPFEFDITPYVEEGRNTLVIRVENDFVHKRSPKEHGGTAYGGDKIYAATGPGYEEPMHGWHHCPPGMGIYQEVYLELRSRCFVQDLFVRPVPEQQMAQLWLEIYECDACFEDVAVEYSLYGQNFRETVFESREYIPFTGCEIGLGDTFTEASMTADGTLNQPVKLYMEKGVNYLKIPFEIPDAHIWEPEHPYLYEIQVTLKKNGNIVLDRKALTFGMRSFRMDTGTKPRGTFYLNGEKIRLRGANTMGHEQQCVMKGDDEQLLEDLLLAKICNMNFLRLTQRPVQEKVYEYCDMIGLMTQTDLPLFGVLRRNKFTEALKQAEEMEKIVRKHPANILVSYINEPFPNAYNQPHRHLLRSELMDFFDCADAVVKLNHPDQVIKHVDGDYDPPNKLLPDNHCYTCWYNGCGVEAGALHKGYWLPVKKDWNYGCGEYGAEGLDSVEIMKKYYPKEWLPSDPEEEKEWSAGRISESQTGNFHYFFYDTPHSLKEWEVSSREHQKWATRWMTEAFRRNQRMVTSAIHLFIDAFPAGWMKAIMDVERNPKPAYFAYRDALMPVMLSLRTDRFTCFKDQTVPVEVWICNDTPREYRNLVLYYEILDDEGSILYQGRTMAEIHASESSCVGVIELPKGMEAGKKTVRAAILDGEEILHTNDISIGVYDEISALREIKACVFGVKARKFASEMDVKIVPFENVDTSTVLIADDMQRLSGLWEEIEPLVENGAKLILMELAAGEYHLGGLAFRIQNSSMMPMNFVSRNTGHELAEGFGNRDFWNWYDREYDMIRPILESTVAADGLIPVLVSGNTDKDGNWGPAAAVGEKKAGKGRIIFCQLKLAGRTAENPVAKEFAARLLRLEKSYFQYPVHCRK